MPGKPRHKKHPHSSRKSKAIQRQTPGTAPSANDSIPRRAAPVPIPARPEVETPPPRPTSSAAVKTYPFIGNELRSIGILAGIILVVLIVLAIVLT